MEYIRIYLSFFNSRKTKKLTRKCGHEGVVCLEKLWIYATQNKQDGVIDLTEEDIELEVDWSGEANKLVEGLLESGYLSKNSSGKYELSNWLENNPHLDPEAVAKRRERAAKGGKAKAQKAKECSTSKQDNPACEQQPSKESLLSSANLTKPNIKEPNQTEHKRTNKEKSIKKKVTAKRDYIPYEKIVEHYNKTFGAHRLPDTAATIGHINNAWEYALKRPDYKDNPEEAFYKVHENVAEKCKKDPSQLEWSKPENIYRMGARSSNFENHLNQLKEKPVDLGRFGSDSV